MKAFYKVCRGATGSNFVGQSTLENKKRVTFGHTGIGVTHLLISTVRSYYKVVSVVGRLPCNSARRGRGNGRGVRAWRVPARGRVFCPQGRLGASQGRRRGVSGPRSRAPQVTRPAKGMCVWPYKLASLQGLSHFHYLALSSRWPPTNGPFVCQVKTSPPPHPTRPTMSQHSVTDTLQTRIPMVSRRPPSPTKHWTALSTPTWNDHRSVFSWTRKQYQFCIPYTYTVKTNPFFGSPVSAMKVLKNFVEWNSVLT